ncbi:DUF418 domain-containing protein [Gallaecimonas sp. GXIMD1310]|uniref:DUF418 domain-containing protein n=1 Tax=Gallaecimonas sp. GXIMD1310 TaxID=3131926 RepID=UPI00325253EB
MNRLPAIDSARGLAIFGILLINIQSFGLLPDYRYLPEGLPGMANELTWWLSSLLADGRFISLLSLLFGMGLSWLARLGRGYQFRRLRWLAVIGLLHAVMIWDGDILLTYALTAMVVLPFIERSARGRSWAGGLLVLLAVISFTLMTALGGADQHIDTTPLAIFQHGSYLAQLYYRVSELALTLFSWPLFTLPFTGGLMLLGSVLAEREDLLAWVQRYSPLMVLLGIIGSAFSLWDWPLLGYGIQLIFAPLQGLGYLGLVLRFGQYWRPLQAAGKLALSHYLLQSVVMTTLFYSTGLYNQLSRPALLAIALVYSLVMIALSPWYLQRHQQGPMEALWRNLAGRPKSG